MRKHFHYHMIEDDQQRQTCQRHMHVAPHAHDLAGAELALERVQQARTLGECAIGALEVRLF